MEPERFTEQTKTIKPLSKKKSTLKLNLLPRENIWAMF